MTRPIALRGPTGTAATTGAELRAEPELDAALEAAEDGGTAKRVLARLGLRRRPRRAALVPARPGARCASGEPARPALRRSPARRDGGRRHRDACAWSRLARAPASTGLRSGAACARFPSTLRLDVVPARPVVSTAEAESAAATIERLLDGPRRVRAGDAVATLTPTPAPHARPHGARGAARSV